MEKNLFTVEVKSGCERAVDADHKHYGEFSTTVRGVLDVNDEDGQYLHRNDVLRVIKSVMNGYGEMYEASQEAIYIMGANMIGAVGALLDNATEPENASVLVDSLPDDVAIPAEWLEA